MTTVHVGQRRVDVIVVRVGAEPAIESIPATLEAQQAIVGGLIQPVDLFWSDDMRLSVVVNEEGLILNLPFNRTVDLESGAIEVVGDMYFARWDSEGEIQSVRLRDIPLILEALR